MPETSPWPLIETARDARVEARVAAILARMSVEQKVGQLIQPEIKHITPEEAGRYHIGSILNGGGTTPYNKRDAGVDDWVNLAEAFHQASVTPTGAGLTGIPIMWGTDAVHGHNNLRGAVLYPHNIGLGAADDLELVGRIGAATAEDVMVTGINWTFSPTVAVVRDYRWGRSYEGYGEDPEIVSRYAGAMVRGLQTAGEGESEISTIATVKHFIGDGGTTNGIDRGDTRATEEELYRLHGQGFVAAVRAGVLSVMASFNSWNSEKIHGHRYLLTDVLKGRLGFDGLVVGDWNAHRQVRGCRVDSCPQVINAGVDIVMVPQDWKALYHNTLAQVKSGVIAQARLDDAVSRVLRVKIKSGLLDAPSPRRRHYTGKSDVIFSGQRRALAREAVRKSLVLLKNNDRVLPISAAARILVAGAGANDIAMQSGGWTLSWQGTGTGRGDFPNATTVYEGICDAVSGHGGSAVFSADGDYPGEVDAVVAVVGEQPYAEWHGDVPGLEFERGEHHALELLRRVAGRQVPVVTVFLSGRPLWVNREINLSDAFVAAWLPGTEGAGIADLIIGDGAGTPRCDFSGKLSFSWPKSPNRLIERDDPLFPCGYGLTYADGAQLPLLAVTGIRHSDHRSPAVEWIFVSRVVPPWKLSVLDGETRRQVVEGNYFKSTDSDPIEVISVDKESQEDARRIVWDRRGRKHIQFRAEKPQSLAHLSGHRGVVQFDLKVDAASLASLRLGAIWDGNRDQYLSLACLAGDIAVGEWTRVTIPMECFGTGEADLTQIALSFNGKHNGVTEIANVRILPVSGDHAPHRGGM